MRLITPKVLKKLEYDQLISPRCRVSVDDPVLDSKVYKIDCTRGLLTAVNIMEELWDSSYSGLLNPTDRVLIKINLNTRDSYPASTDPYMLKALITMLIKTGVTKILVGDCSSLGALPTKGVARATGVLKAIGRAAEFEAFDKSKWSKIKIDGQYLKEITVPAIVAQVDRIISLCNLKTHLQAGFSCGLKHSVGYMHPLERYELHKEYICQKIAEINLAIQPDITIVDARRVFVDGGPAKGRAETGNFVLIGTNQLAVESEAYKQLFNIKTKCNCLGNFKEDPFENSQLLHARNMKIGGYDYNGYELINL